MVRVVLAAAVCALVLSACDYGSEARGDAAEPTSNLRRGTAIIDTGEESTLIDVEVAQTPAERARGLMGRRSLPEDQGMVFIFFEENRGGFWMKNTLIPLSIAFFDEEGRILEILDMKPCRKDPCRIYDPGVAYWGALEVNEGAFDRWGAEEGDRISIVQ
jgi:uncharacterized membrane protein (UPF0127 family)